MYTVYYNCMGLCRTYPITGIVLYPFSCCQSVIPTEEGGLVLCSTFIAAVAIFSSILDDFAYVVNHVAHFVFGNICPHFGSGRIEGPSL